MPTSAESIQACFAERVICSYQFQFNLSDVKPGTDPSFPYFPGNRGTRGLTPVSMFRFPAGESPFEPLGEPREQNSRTCNHDDADKHRVCLERLAAIRNHVADALAPSAKDFTDHHADQTK